MTITNNKTSISVLKIAKSREASDYFVHCIDVADIPEKLCQQLLVSSLDDCMQGCGRAALAHCFTSIGGLESIEKSVRGDT